MVFLWIMIAHYMDNVNVLLMVLLYKCIEKKIKGIVNARQRQHLLIYLSFMPLWGSLFLLSSYISLKKESLRRAYSLIIKYLYTHQILFSNLFESFRKFLLKYFFLPLFLKPSNLILIFFNSSAVFYLVMQIVP